MHMRHANADFLTRSDSLAAQSDPWFVAQLKPNSEAIALRNLTRQGFNAFVPRHRTTLRKAGQFRETLRPLFPGYAFVTFNPEGGHWRAINSTQGITRLVSFSTRPNPLPEGFVEGLRDRCDTQGQLRPIEALAPGDRARITEGPFSDFLVQVESVSDDQRLCVLFDLLGRQTRLALPHAALCKA
jgi:transcriptional antiterminator RfaH